MSTEDDEDEYRANAPTPPIRKARYVMPPDERDGAAHRRAVTEGERRRHAELYASGMPVVVPEPPEPDTGPIAMLEAIELDGEDLRQMQRLRRDSPDPYVGMMKSVKLIRQLRKELRSLAGEQSSNNQTRANQILDLLNRPPHEDVAELQRNVAALQTMAEDVEALSKAMAELGPVRSGMRRLYASLVIVVLTIGGWLYTRGGNDTEIKLRIQYLEHSLEQLQQGHKP